MPLDPQAQAVVRPRRTRRRRPTWLPRNAAAADAPGGAGLLIAIGGGEAEPVFEVDDRDADGVPGARVPAARLMRICPFSCCFHGGGWVIGSVEQFDAIARQARERGRVRSSCRSTTGSRPSTRSRRRSTTAGARSSGSRRTPPRSAATRTRIAVGGDSAGGNLAAVVRAARPRRGRTALALQMLVYPVCDCRLRHGVVRRATARATSSRPSRCAGSSIATRGGAADPAQLAISPLRAAGSRGRRAGGRAHRGVRPAARRGRGVRRCVCATQASPVEHRRYDGLIHGFFGLSGCVRRESSTRSTRSGRRCAGRSVRSTLDMAVIDVAGFVADLKDHAVEHGFHVHDERHFVESYSLRQTWEVDLHPEEGCEGPVDLYLSLEIDPRVLLGFEDAVIALDDDGSRRRLPLPAQLHVGAPAAAARSGSAGARDGAGRCGRSASCRVEVSATDSYPVGHRCARADAAHRRPPAGVAARDPAGRRGAVRHARELPRREPVPARARGRLARLSDASGCRAPGATMVA